MPFAFGFAFTVWYKAKATWVNWLHWTERELSRFTRSCCLLAMLPPNHGCITRTWYRTDNMVVLIVPSRNSSFYCLNLFIIFGSELFRKSWEKSALWKHVYQWRNETTFFGFMLWMSNFIELSGMPSWTLEAYSKCALVFSWFSVASRLRVFALRNALRSALAFFFLLFFTWTPLCTDYKFHVI